MSLATSKPFSKESPRQHLKEAGGRRIGNIKEIMIHLYLMLLINVNNETPTNQSNTFISIRFSPVLELNLALCLKPFHFPRPASFIAPEYINFIFLSYTSFFVRFLGKGRFRFTISNMMPIWHLKQFMASIKTHDVY